MKHLYYLAAQLPTLPAGADGEQPLPITYSYFCELCARLMPRASRDVLARLAQGVPRESKPTGSRFADEWLARERALRFALAAARARHLRREGEVFPAVSDPDALHAAETAAGIGNPYAAELFLVRYRLGVLESLTRRDIFTVDAVFSYAIKLMMLERIQKFNKDDGLASYHKIYDEILNAAGGKVPRPSSAARK